MWGWRSSRGLPMLSRDHGGACAPAAAPHKRTRIKGNGYRGLARVKGGNGTQTLCTRLGPEPGPGPSPLLQPPPQPRCAYRGSGREAEHPP